MLHRKFSAADDHMNIVALLLFDKDLFLDILMGRDRARYIHDRIWTSVFDMFGNILHKLLKVGVCDIPSRRCGNHI